MSSDYPMDPEGFLDIDFTKPLPPSPNVLVDDKALEQALRDAFPFAKDWKSESPKISLSAPDGSTLFLSPPNQMHPKEWIAGLEFVPFSEHLTAAENPYDAIAKLKATFARIQKLTEGDNRNE